MKFMEVLPDIYQLRVRRTNVTILGGEEITLIDAGIPGSADRILEFLRYLGHSPSEVSLIIITHHHIDHVGSLAELKERTGARVAVHRLDAPYVDGEKKQPNPFYHGPLAYLFWPLSLFAPTKSTFVDLLLEDGDELSNSGGLRIIHTPGHSPGSISVLNTERGLLIVGDALNHRGGTLSFPPRKFSYDPGQARDSIGKLASLEFNAVCMGHGLPLTQHARESVQALAMKA